jgi:predicted permease
MNRAISSLILLFGSLALGYLAQRWLRPRNPALAQRASALLKRTQVLVFAPATLLLSFWALDLSHRRLLALPALGVASHLVGGGLALGLARYLRLGPKATGSFVVCGMFTNLLSFGGLLNLTLLGERAFILAVFFRCLEPVFYYTVGFAVANFFGTGQRPAVAQTIRDTFSRSVTLVPLGGLVLGVLLWASPWERPGVLMSVNSTLVRVAAALLMIAVGLSVRPGRLRQHLREAAGVAVIKFVGIPLVLVTAAWALGYGSLEDGLPLKMVAIMSAMPVAFNALIPPTLFGLDEDLSNSCWLLTTAAMFIVVPVLAGVTGN